MNYIKNSNICLSGIVYVLMVLSTLYLSDITTLKMFGQTCIYMNILIVTINILSEIVIIKKMNKHIFKLYAILYIFFIYMLLNILINTNQNIEDALIKSIILILILIFPLSISRLKFGYNFYNTITVVNILHLIFLLNFIAKEDADQIGFMAYTANPNALAMVIYILIVFISLITLKNKNIVYKIYIVIMIYFLILTKSRTTILALFISLGIYFLLSNFKKITFKNIFLVTIVILSSLLFIYIRLKDTELGNFLDKISLDIFDKSLFSGRNLIWSDALNIIKEEPIFGYGIKGGNYYILSSQRGFHNFYIEITMKLGIVGLFFILFYIYNIFKIIDLYCKNKEEILLSSYFLGVLIIQMFESTMGLSGMGIGLFQWFVISIAINYVLYR